MNLTKEYQTLRVLAMLSAIILFESPAALLCSLSAFKPVSSVLRTISYSFVMFEATCLIKSFSVMKGDGLPFPFWAKAIFFSNKLFNINSI